mmetsp:Transcript_11544/g.17413  ORF Transcript_11544/g.17413 Transcript_11544/m.17413 type:complete len:114 (-) Transcript_11544:219-560(-)
MSSESILEYPALFSGEELHDLDKLAMEYMEFYKKYPGEADMRTVKAHLHKFLHSGFNIHGHTDIRDKLNRIPQKDAYFNEYVEVIEEMARRRKDVPLIDKISWYYRHMREDYG